MQTKNPLLVDKFHIHQVARRDSCQDAGQYMQSSMFMGRSRRLSFQVQKKFELEVWTCMDPCQMYDPGRPSDVPPVVGKVPVKNHVRQLGLGEW